MFIQKLMLSCISLTLATSAIAQAPTAAEVDKSAVVNFPTCDKPQWPKASLQKEETGTVVLSFLIGTDGKVEDAAITRSSGHTLLDAAAVNGIKKCQFKPGMQDGKPVRSWMAMQYVWTLEGRNESAATTKEVEKYRDDAIKGEPGAMYRLAKAYSSTRTPEDAALALRLYQAAAAKDHPDAVFEVALALRFGKGLPQNRAEAMNYHLDAAELGSVNAQHALGIIYKKGSDDEKRDAVKAAAWFKKAAEQGNPNSQNELGQMYAAGLGVPKDPVEAAKWFQKSANNGLVEGQRSFGQVLLSGKGVERDIKAAAMWLRKAADQRDPAAEATLALLYFSGKGVDVDNAEGFKLMGRAAYASQTRAQVLLGFMHAKGIRTAVDHKQANALYRRAAELGDALGMNNLGYSYEMGYEFKQDYAVAMGWYLKAAARGNANAKAAIGGLYEKGLGVETNVSTALKWYLEAVELKNADGMCRLARLYENGVGVEKSAAIALDWYQKSAALGDELAMRRLSTAYSSGELGLTVNASLGKQWLQGAELRAAGMGTIFSLDDYHLPSAL